jgi:hypothetical protein
MRAVYRSVAGAVAAGVFSGASPDLAQAARLETRPLRIQSDFQHFPPTGPSYATRITGVLDLHFAAATDGTAQATAVLRKGSCFATVGWSVASMPPGHTAPAEVCLAHDAADESGFNAWMAAQTGTDPSLVIALSGSGMPPTAWSNPSPVPVRLFLRGCGVDLYRPLARLLVPPGGLIVQTFTDPDGDAQLGLAAMSVALVDVTPTVWADVLMGCGGAAAGLPTAPALGMSTQFIATTDTPSDDPSRPHVQIALIKDAVEDLVETQALSAGKGRALVRKLDGSVKKLRQAKPDKAIRRLDRFQTLTTVFEQRGFLSMTAGAMLRAQAAGAAAGILMITIDGTAGPPDPSLFCDPVPAVCPSLGSTYTTYYVRAFAGIGLVPDGSAARPYRTIVDALDAAQANALPGVELLVAGGLYSGDLLITRNTRIIGDARGNPVIEGSIISDGAYRLVLQDVRIIPDAGVGISVDNPCAETRVDGVRVENATGYGILQRGGSIEIADTLVDATQSEDVNLTRGTGIYLTCGVDAQVDDVILTNNESAALVVIGEDTTAEGADLRVVGTGVHRSSPPTSASRRRSWRRTGAARRPRRVRRVLHQRQRRHRAPGGGRGRGRPAERGDIPRWHRDADQRADGRLCRWDQRHGHRRGDAAAQQLQLYPGRSLRTLPGARRRGRSLRRDGQRQPHRCLHPVRRLRPQSAAERGEIHRQRTQSRFRGIAHSRAGWRRRTVTGAGSALTGELTERAAIGLPSDPTPARTTRV